MLGIFFPVILLAEWQIQIVDTRGGAGASLALDSQKNPYISYGDSDRDILKYACLVNSDWHIMAVESLIVRYFSPIASLYLIDDSVPIIAYYYENAGNLKIAYLNDSVWETITVDSLGDTGFAPSVVVDHAGNIHISYAKKDSWDLKYAVCQDSVWEVHIIDTTNIRIFFSGLAIDSNGNPHITYDELIGNSQGYLKYAYKQNESWHIVVFDSNETPLPGAIAMDSLSHPHILYSVAHSLIKYAYWDGTSWTIEVVHGVPRQVNCYDISLDRNGFPHIVYSIDEMGVWYAYKTPQGVWEREQVISGIFGQVSLALDSNDTPHIAFHDSRTFYARRSEVGIEDKKSGLQDKTITIFPNPARSSVKIGITGGYKKIESLRIFDVSGRLVCDLSSKWCHPPNMIIWDMCDNHNNKVKSGIYFLEAKIGSKSIKKKVIVLK